MYGDDAHRQPASFRGSRLRISEEGLHYEGRGLGRRGAFQASASSVTAVGVTQWFTLHRFVALVPVMMFVPALLASVAAQDPDLFFNVLLLFIVLAPFLLPLVWLTVPGYAIRVVVGGTVLQVPFHRRRLGEATSFARRASTTICTLPQPAVAAPARDPQTPKTARE